MRNLTLNFFPRSSAVSNWKGSIFLGEASENDVFKIFRAQALPGAYVAITAAMYRSKLIAGPILRSASGFSRFGSVL